MKGLILKDLMNLKRQGRTLLVGLLVWLFITIINKNLAFSNAFLIMYMAFLPMTLISMDERAGGERFALCMPVSSDDIVFSRYVLALLFALVSLVISTALSLFLGASPAESFQLALGYLSMSLCFAAIYLPILHKFGTEKGRLLVMAAFLLPAGVAFFLSDMEGLPSEATLERLLCFAPLLALALLALSLWLSIRIYRKKEF